MRDFFDGTKVTALQHTLVEKSQRSQSGYRGVAYNKRTGKYCAVIRLRYKNYYFGAYDTLREAIDARARAVKKYHLPVIEEFEEEKGEIKDAKRENEKNH